MDEYTKKQIERENKKRQHLQSAVDNLTDALNDISFGADEASAMLMSMIIQEHRTIQQELIGTLINLIVRYADTEWYDGRNEASKKVCVEIRGSLENKGLLYDNKIHLPFI